MSVEDAQKEREMAFVGDLLFPNLPPHKMMECVDDEGVRREYFKDPDCRAVFDALMADRDSDDTERLMRISGAAKKEWLERCRDMASINEHFVRANVRLLAETAREQIAKEKAERLMAEYRGGKLGLDGLSRKLAELTEQTRPSRANDVQGRTPDELGPQVPEEENPDALFRNGWLRKGNAAFLVAETDKGKSVLSLQMAYCWARGVAAFGIEPMRPLNIAVFQTEDDEDEMRTFRDNLKRGFAKIHKWTDEDLKAANGNIHLYSTDGLVGDAFAAHLRRQLIGKGIDLVIINPLQGVFGGDLNQNSELSGFLRTKLDGVIKAELTKCGVLIVHHTNKPPLNPQLRRNDAYMGAGGAEISNWMRAMLVLEEQKRKGPGTFHLVAAKRGGRLGWPKQKTHGQPYVEIRQAPKEEDLIFWLDGDSAAPLGTGEAKSEEEQLEEDRRLFAEELKREPISRTDARNLARSKFGRKRGDDIYEEMMGHLCDNGLAEIVEGNKRLIVCK
jgi:hypothetical protein